MKSFIIFLLSFFNITTGTLLGSNPQAAPCTVIIFGATGDLTARKLVPAIYNLAHDAHLAPQTAVVGFARRQHTHETFRKQMGLALTQFSRIKDPSFQADFENKIFYNPSDFDQDQGYENLKTLLSEIDQTSGNRLYYLATSPSYFCTIIQKLHEHGLISQPNDTKWSRVILEKPFGNDLSSAIHLHKTISRYLAKDQIYLMDHYLGKEGVQNLLTLRFENALFEPLWNNQYIDNIQITLAEDIGIGTRANFWEQTGSLRDVFQNHLMQLLAMIAMESPVSLEASHIQEEKVKVLNALRIFQVIRGQYGPGMVHGIAVPGYHKEKGVSETSSAETFVASKLFIDNPRWEGVPFYIRGGKRLAKQTTEIVVTFKNSSLSNALFIRIQPNAGVFLKTLSKVPGLDKNVAPVLFGYKTDAFFKMSSPEAYEKLFYDCIKGDHSLFVSAEEQLIAWALLTPVLNDWKLHPETMRTYEAGAWGPCEADEMLKEQGHQWLLYDGE